MKMVNLLTPIARIVDAWLPFPPTSLIAVMERRTRAPEGAAGLDLSREREPRDAPARDAPAGDAPGPRD
jgi:hypothetical protein